MNILFDQNISFRILGLIQDKFPDARHVKEFSLQFASDIEIWKYAKSNSFHLVTFDADFYDLAALFGHPPKIIWLRIGNTSTQNLSNKILSHFEVIRSFLTEEDYMELACLEIN